jgi:CheY-like chemotaxis protein
MKPIVLIVDDEERNLALLNAILVPEGYDIVKAETGEKCLEILSKQNVNIILLDVMMPGLSGYDVLKKVRENEHTKVIPVILLTALREKKDMIKGIELGADDFISKPFDREELVTRVKTYVNLSFIRNQLADKEKLLTVIEKVKEGVIITNRDYKPSILNKKAKELLEIGDNIPTNMLTYMQDIFKSNINCDEEICEFVFERAETSFHNPLYLLVTMEPVKNPEEEIDSYVFFVRDITEKHLENRLHFDFLSLISHKLNTPLLGISAGIELLKGKLKETDKDCEKVFKILSNNSTRLNVLISRLLWFVKIENNDLKNAVETEEIDKLISKLGIKYTDIKYEIEKDIKVNNLVQYKLVIIEELLDNSFKFYSGSNLRIIIKVTDTEIFIKDNGSGFPPEEREKIFEPFYQIDKYFTGQVAGAGLGLPLIKKLSEIFMFKIEYESKIAFGTEFRIIFS